MDNTLIFATNNVNKVIEVKAIVGDAYKIISLQEAGILEEIPEPFETIEANAVHKASFIFNKYNLPCFSEDTGLIVPALNGAPGVKSARYAGEHATAQENIAKLLNNLTEEKNRAAYFKTVIVYYTHEIKLFEGICDGTITKNLAGDTGFGYDPIFIPNGSQLTFAQMTMDEKNRFSHRKKAMKAFLTHINKTAT